MRWRWWFLVLLLPGAASAQQGPAWYTVEAVIFERAVAADGAGEAWPPLDSLPALDAATPLLPAFGAEEVLGHVPFRLLPEAEHRLSALARTLEASPRFHVLRHVAWRQPGLEPEQAVAVRLQARATEALLADRLLRESLGTVPATPDVDGVLRLVVSRFLHVETDLVYHRPAAQRGGAAGGELRPALETYRLTESRRMRSREVHYLDHPLFGIIVTVQPYTPPAPTGR